MHQYYHCLRKKRLRGVVAAVAICILFLPAALWGQPNPPLSFELFTDQAHPDREFVLGEAISIILVLKNLSGYDVITREGFAQGESLC